MPPSSSKNVMLSIPLSTTRNLPKLLFLRLFCNTRVLFAAILCAPLSCQCEVGIIVLALSVLVSSPFPPRQVSGGMDKVHTSAGHFAQSSVQLHVHVNVYCVMGSHSGACPLFFSAGTSFRFSQDIRNQSINNLSVSPTHLRRGAVKQTSINSTRTSAAQAIGRNKLWLSQLTVDVVHFLCKVQKSKKLKSKLSKGRRRR